MSSISDLEAARKTWSAARQAYRYQLSDALAGASMDFEALTSSIERIERVMRELMSSASRLALDAEESDRMLKMSRRPELRRPSRSAPSLD